MLSNTESGGFGPPEALWSKGDVDRLSSTDYKSVALSHSANSPYLHIIPYKITCLWIQIN